MTWRHQTKRGFHWNPHCWMICAPAWLVDKWPGIVKGPIVKELDRNRSIRSKKSTAQQKYRQWLQWMTSLLLKLCFSSLYATTSLISALPRLSHNIIHFISFHFIQYYKKARVALQVKFYQSHLLMQLPSPRSWHLLVWVGFTGLYNWSQWKILKARTTN